MLMSLVIRPFEETDLADIVDILNPFIQDTAVTFDTEPYTEESRKPWSVPFSITGRYQCLVAEFKGKVVGYANSSRLREKAAYDTSVEVSIYRAPEVPYPGLGSMLYKELFSRLAHEDIHRAHALITLPNDASVAIHQRFGFYEVGTLNEAGRKFGRYHSVLWMEKKLR
jgi:phosphinothricin acetyltransferase